MDRTRSSSNLQQNLWKAIEMALNSQLYTPNARSRFKELITSCAVELGLTEDNEYRHLRNSIQIVSALYKKYLDQVQLHSPNNNTKVIRFDHKINFEDYDSNVANFLRRFEDYIKKNLTPFALGIFLHGSLATNDYTGFSDVDAGIFVKDEVMGSPDLLRKLQKKIKGALRLILKFDNLQHHGLFIIPEGFLMNYPEEYLPLVVFKYSRAVGGSFQLALCARRNRERAREKFIEMARAFSREEFRKPRNLYELKHRLSMFMLLPTLYLQTEGEYVYKKYSFEIAKNDFKEYWPLMKVTARIRGQWKRLSTPIFDYWLSIVPNPWVVSFLYRKFDWSINPYYLEYYNGIARNRVIGYVDLLENTVKVK